MRTTKTMAALLLSCSAITPVMVTPVSASAAEWIGCAREYGTCSFVGKRVVRYGVAGKGFIEKVAEGNVYCADSSFGAPATNYENGCSYSSETTDAAVNVANGGKAVAASNGWVDCALQYDNCKFEGTKNVRYGTPTLYITKEFKDGAFCSNDTFGNDPAPGQHKTCSIQDANAVIGEEAPPPLPGDTTQDPGSPTWQLCANEHEKCDFPGKKVVKYGTEDNFTSKMVEGGVLCSNSIFGDPAVGTLKKCWYDLTGAAEPSGGLPYTPSPSPSPTPTGSPAPSQYLPPAGGPVGPRSQNFTGSGPITASAGQVISGVRISNPGGECIVIPAGATGVTVRDSDIGPCGGSSNILVEASGAVIEYNTIHEGNRGVLARYTNNVTTRFNYFETFYGPKFNGTAIEYDWMGSGHIEGNQVRGNNYASDAVSVFESGNMTLINNDINVNIAEWSAAGFTMGDAVNGPPGANNYVAGNVVIQSGGVPAGVFGSGGNTILEKNCLTAGIQAYNYSGIFAGVTVRNNVINKGASFIQYQDFPIDEGTFWSQNINGTDCSQVQR